MFIRFISLLFVVVFLYSGSVIAVGGDDVDNIDGVGDAVILIPGLVGKNVSGCVGLEKDIVDRALKKGVFKEITIANNNMLPVKVMGQIIWVSLISVGMGLNLLVVHLENGDCANILSSDSALQKIGAVLGGAPIAVSSVRDLFFHVKGEVMGKRKTFMSFLPCNRNGDDNGVELDASVLEKDERAVNSNKHEKSKTLAVLSVVLKVAFAFIDVSYDAYAAGVSGGCLFGRPTGFFLGLFWNGIPSFATALLGSTQLIEFISAPFVGGSPRARRTRDLVAEVQSCNPWTGDRSEVSVSVKLTEENIDDWVDKVREKFIANKVGLLEGFAVGDSLGRDLRVSKRMECMKLFVVMAMSLVGGFAMSSIFASQTILNQVAESGLHVNGTQVTFSDPALGFAFKNETCNAVAGDKMVLINQPLLALSSMAIWSSVAYLCQGVDVTFVFMKTCVDTYEVLRVLTNKKKREIFASQSRSYRCGKYIGLTLGATLVGLYSWNAFGAMVPAVQQQYLYRCIGSMLGKLPAPLFVGYGITALAGLFIQGHTIIGNTLEGVFDAIGRVCCCHGSGKDKLEDASRVINDKVDIELMPLEGQSLVGDEPEAVSPEKCINNEGVFSERLYEDSEFISEL